MKDDAPAQQPAACSELAVALVAQGLSQVHCGAQGLGTANFRHCSLPRGARARH